MTRMIVKTKDQIAEVWKGTRFLKSYVVSTAANGIGCEVGSYCTPTGRLRVAEKIGEGSPVGAVFKARLHTGEIWNPSTAMACEKEPDLILTRILWLEGMDEANQNTFERYIYLHGTNHEDQLGRPVSHGCVRFSNNDIIDVFEQLEVGSEVVIE